MALVVAHIDLAKAEAGAIAGQVGRVIALGALAFILVVFAVFLLVIGVSLGLGEWVFGSMGWGVIHGVLFFLSVAMAAVLLAIGIAGGAYGATKVQQLKPGQSMTIRGYRLDYLGTVVHRGPNSLEERARLAVSRGNERPTLITPGKNDYPAEQQVSNEVAIHTDWVRAQDLFVIGDQLTRTARSSSRCS